jgi:hypothetical protein
MLRRTSRTATPCRRGDRVDHEDVAPARRLVAILSYLKVINNRGDPNGSKFKNIPSN